jgi:ribonuclease HII
LKEKYKLQAYYKLATLEAGCDEAGRGCLAGPVVAAAVILPKGFSHPLLNDSKQLSEKKRELLRPIIEQEAIAYGIGIVSHIEIDEINILQASILAMHRALDKLEVRPKHIIVDGNKFNAYQNISHNWIIKGDAKFRSIAAASVLAKTYRDAIMQDLHKEFPNYDWHKNKGYPTKAHRTALVKHGVTKYHRQSFNLIPVQLKLFP